VASRDQALSAPQTSCSDSWCSRSDFQPRAAQLADRCPRGSGVGRQRAVPCLPLRQELTEGATRMTLDQRLLTTSTIVAAPLVGLAFAAGKTEGALKRAGKTGVVSGLVGAFGFSLYWAEDSSYSEKIDAAIGGAAVGGGLGVVLGVVGSLARDALR
jgi:hypothetical protein